MRRPLPTLLTLALLCAAPGARADFFGAPVSLYALPADEAAGTEPQGEAAPAISDITVEQEPAPRSALCGTPRRTNGTPRTSAPGRP